MTSGLKGYFFIYNLPQAKYFIKEGLVPEHIGLGTRNDIYLKFIRDEKSEEVFTKWIKLEKDIRGDRMDEKCGTYKKY